MKDAGAIKICCINLFAMLFSKNMFEISRSKTIDSVYL